MMKMCSVCRTPKEETEFRLMKKRTDGIVTAMLV